MTFVTRRPARFRRAQSKSEPAPAAPEPAVPPPADIDCLCGKRLRVRPDDEAKVYACPACSRRFELAAEGDAQLPMWVDEEMRTAEAPIPAEVVLPETSLEVLCSCGRKLRVPSSATGKLVRCPACSRTTRLSVPGASTPPPAPAVEPPPTEPASEIELPCVCGAHVVVPFDDRSRTPCPSCGVEISLQFGEDGDPMPHFRCDE